MLKAKKQLGQNFLIDENVPQDMVGALDVRKEDFIVEIGPGTGMVTKKLLEKDFNNLLGIELDKDMVNILEKDFEKEISENKLKIENTNVLDFLPEFGKRSSEKNLKIIGSLPYYITSPILHKIVYMENRAQTVVILIQKEVAEKITELEPKASYLSTFVNTFFETTIVDFVDREAFDPIPNVDSAIVKMSLKNNIPIENQEIKKYEGFLHKAFSNPRKMLNKVFTLEELGIFGIEAQSRPQEISVKKWIDSFKKIVSQPKGKQ